MENLLYPQRIDLDHLGGLIQKPGLGSPSTAVPPNSPPQAEALRRLPADLSRLLRKPTLLNLCLESAQLATPAELAEARKRKHSATPELLVTLLTYCYSTGLFASRDIEAAVLTDRTLRYLCTGHRLDWRSLRRFRREHRSLLERTLAHVIQRTHRLGLGNSADDAVERDEQSSLTAITRLDLAVWLDDCDAEGV